MVRPAYLTLVLLIGFAPVETGAQSAPPRRDIPSIAKTANGSIVSVVMANKEGKPIAEGSGFVVSRDGLILTNYHVIAEGSSAIVKFPNGSFFVVDGVVAADKLRDIAVIKARGENFRTVPLGNSDRVQIGEEVVAIGNPLSLESTVSNGIVSGIRSIKEEGGKYLQITAPISPGSSGGPLFNMVGEVVGITTMYLQGGENLNFAIPINDAKPLLELESAKLQDFPNEPDSAKVRKQGSDAPPPASTTASAPDLKTTVDFMNRMVEPEERVITDEAILHSNSNNLAVTMVSVTRMDMAVIDGIDHKNGYPKVTFSVATDGGKHEQKDYPRFMSFALADIDPSSIKAIEGGYDPSMIAQFIEKHPSHCEANPECSDEYHRFLGSAPKLTMVLFHTTDLKPLIEDGNCSTTGHCRLTEMTGRILIFFRNKDRAQRFVTALTYAVKLAGGKPDLFPPTPYSQKD